MKDLFLTPRGDLAIRNISSDTKRLEINFITSNSNALRLNFYIEDTFQYKPNANSLSINFSINKPEYNKEIEMISGDAYMEQAIKIRLSTALGSLEGNRDIGSKLELIIHEFIDVQATHTNLEKLIKEAIYDLIPNAQILIQKPKTKYTDYSTNLSVVIVDGDKKYNINI
jgi:phage baseplate assembly protein W|nr:MAG TPA: baseplate wedge protein [Ackermannviridae sp.]